MVAASRTQSPATRRSGQRSPFRSTAPRKRSQRLRVRVQQRAALARSHAAFQDASSLTRREMRVSTPHGISSRAPFPISSSCRACSADLTSSSRTQRTTRALPDALPGSKSRREAPSSLARSVRWWVRSATSRAGRSKAAPINPRQITSSTALGAVEDSHLPSPRTTCQPIGSKGTKV